MFAKIRLFGSVAVLYFASIAIVILLITHSEFARSTVRSEVALAAPKPHKPVATPPEFVSISGKPVRVTIPDSAIDLALDEGHYDSATSEWSLSEVNAQFAMMTTPANNSTGTTFIYGHGTDAVFGKIGSVHPQPGAQALIYTDNNRIFSYRFQEVHDTTPEDTSILYARTGPPILVIQTCTGVFSEWRTMFTFTFEKVIQ